MCYSLAATHMPTLTLPDFVNKWRSSGLTERAGAQMQFLDLCDVLGEPHPAPEDFSGATYRFEKSGTTIEGQTRLCRCLEARLLWLGVQGQAQEPSCRVSATNIVRIWKIRRSLWCVTLSGSRFIPTSRARQSKSIASRLTIC